MSKNEMKIFLDSNVILSGLLSAQGSPKILLDLFSIRVPLLFGMTGVYNIEEIERNLTKKFPALLPIYKEYFPKLNLQIIPLPSIKEVFALSQKMSPKDAPVLASAISGKADYLVTGDKKGFPQSVVAPIHLVNPKELLNILAQKIDSQNS